MNKLSGIPATVSILNNIAGYIVRHSVVSFLNDKHIACGFSVSDLAAHLVNIAGSKKQAH